MSSDTYEVHGTCYNCKGKNYIILKKGIPANSRDSVIISEEMECATCGCVGFILANAVTNRDVAMDL